MVTLRAPVPEDIEMLFEWSQDRTVARRWRFYHEVPGRAGFGEGILAGVLAHAVIETRDRVPIGYATAYNADFRSQICMAGSVMGPACTAPGLVALGSAWFLDSVFRDYNLRRVYLEVYGHNQPAADAALRRGGELEGVLRDDLFLDGRYFDRQIVAIRREAWLERRHPARTRPEPGRDVEHLAQSQLV
jgi:hypothetical protein